MSRLEDRSGTAGGACSVASFGTGGRGFDAFEVEVIDGESADGGTALSRPWRCRSEGGRGPSKTVGRMLYLGIANAITSSEIP